MLTGKLILRNPGASGLGREVLLALHPAFIGARAPRGAVLSVDLSQGGRAPW